MEASQETITEFNNNDNNDNNNKKITVIEKVVKIKDIDFFKVKLIHIDGSPLALVLCSCKFFLESRL